MDTPHRSEDEEQSHNGGGSSRCSRFGARRLKPRSSSHHQLLLMDCVGNGGGASKEAVPLPEYARLSQSPHLPDDPDPKNLLRPVKQSALPLQPRQQQRPAAWRLIEYVRSRYKSGGAGVASGCVSSDGDSKSSDGEREGDDGGEKRNMDKKKKRSSWLPDPDRRWPVQGFY